jgi:hypothetical protein
MKKEPPDPVAAHLEYYGYTMRPMSDGWIYCEHQRRLNICFRKVPSGWRLFAALVLGRSLGDLREMVLEALNTMNEKSDVARFSLNRDSDGDFLVRVRAAFHADYRRQDFGLFVDMWQSDLERLSDLPRIPQVEEEDDRVGETATPDTRVVN